MVHHIVMWKFKPEIEENKKEELKKAMEENLTALVGKIPGLLTLEFVACPFGSSTHDMALVSKAVCDRESMSRLLIADQRK